MNILIINCMETTAAGGINIVVRKTALGLKSRGHKIQIVQPNPLAMKLEDHMEGIPIFRVGYKLSFYGYSPGLENILKKILYEENIELIHIHGYQTLFCLQTLLYFKYSKRRIPIVLTLHYDKLSRNTLGGKYLGDFYDNVIGLRLLKNINHFISISQREAKQLETLFSIPKNLITIIPNGVDQINYNVRNQKTRDVFTLLFVGYLIKIKGVQRILHGLNELVNVRGLKHFRLIIIGEGPYKTELLQLAKRLNVQDFVTWRPFAPHEEIMQTYKEVDAFILLSFAESYGIVVAEALASGTPAIITRGTALDEFASEPGCLSVPTNPSPSEIADAILFIEHGEIEVGPFSNKIKLWTDVINDYESVYYKIIKKYNCVSHTSST